MDVFIGLDVSLASTAICVLGEKGKIVTEAQVASAPDALVSFIHELPHGIEAIGLEAGPLSQWLHKGLTDAGFEAVLMETRQVKAALKAMPIKTDRRDAEGIARLLQMGWFRPVHCKTASSQEMRALLTSRKSVLDALTNLELSLRGVLRNFGLKLGQISKGRYEARVRELIAGNAMLEAAAEPILRARAGLRHELSGLEKMVRNLAKQDRACQLLMTMPGALLPNRLIAFEHAIQIGTRESSWTRHYVGSRCADHGRKREPGDGHTRDRGPFSVPRSRVRHRGIVDPSPCRAHESPASAKATT